MKFVLTILLLISSIFIIVPVLMRESKNNGVSALSGETNVGGIGGKKTKDAILSYIVVVASVVFLISAILMSSKFVK